MSIEAHPNVQAVQLMMKVAQAVRDALRGPGAQLHREMEFSILDESKQFATHMSEKIDEWVAALTQPAVAEVAAPPAETSDEAVFGA